MFRSLGVHRIELLFTKTFRNTSSMNHIIEDMILKLFLQIVLRRKIQFNEMDTFILQPFARTASPDGCPYFHVAFQCLFHDKATDESRGACNQYPVHSTCKGTNK